VVRAAAGNADNRKEVMALLLKQRGEEVHITEEVVKAAAGNSSSEVMLLLLDKRRDDVPITTLYRFERFAPTLSRFYGWESWRYLKG
jgi:hypothetical protein